MSVLVEFAMFPTDKGESVSPYVARVLTKIDTSGIVYQLTPMGTIFETQTMEEAVRLIQDCYKTLEPDCNRVYATVKFDIRKGSTGRIKSKVESLKEKANKQFTT